MNAICSLSNKTKKLILFLISICLFSAYFYLFYAQLTATNGRYSSDIAAHLNFALNGKGYSFLYKIIGLLYRYMGGVVSIAVLESLIMIGTWFGTAKFVNLLVYKKDFFLSAITSLPVMFLCGIYVPKFFPHFYNRQLVSQPYHNITYIAMRMFAVFAMIMFVKVFEGYKEKMNWKGLVVLAVILTLSTMVKPSFFYGFALTLLIFLVYDFFTNRFNFALFGKMVAIGCVVLPSLLVMYFQANVLYAKSAAEGGTSIALVWGANFIRSGIIKTPLKVLCGLAFPVLVGCVNFKRLSRTEVFVYMMCGVQLAVYIIFAEVGARENHGNFAWGVYSAAFFMFLSVAVRFVDNLKHRSEFSKPYIICGSLLAIAHVLSSLTYFILLMHGAVFFQ